MGLLWRQNLLIQVEANAWHMANSTAIIILVGLSLALTIFSEPTVHDQHQFALLLPPGTPFLTSPLILQANLIPAPKSKLNNLPFRWWEKKSSETEANATVTETENGRDGNRSQEPITLHSGLFSPPGRDLHIFVEQKMYPYALHKALFLDMITGWQ